MSAADRPVSKSSLIRLEAGDRDPTLDEALALAWYFGASLTAWLTPLDDDELQVSGHDALDVDATQDWLRYGLGSKELWRARLADEVAPVVAEQAGAALDAYRAKDDAGMRAACTALVKTMTQYNRAHARFVDSPTRAYGWDGMPVTANAEGHNG